MVGLGGVSWALGCNGECEAASEPTDGCMPSPRSLWGSRRILSDPRWETPGSSGRDRLSAWVCVDAWMDGFIAAGGRMDSVQGKAHRTGHSLKVAWLSEIIIGVENSPSPAPLGRSPAPRTPGVFEPSACKPVCSSTSKSRQQVRHVVFIKLAELMSLLVKKSPRFQQNSKCMGHSVSMLPQLLSPHTKTGRQHEEEEMGSRKNPMIHPECPARPFLGGATWLNLKTGGASHARPMRRPDWICHGCHGLACPPR